MSFWDEGRTGETQERLRIQSAAYYCRKGDEAAREPPRAADSQKAREQL